KSERRVAVSTGDYVRLSWETDRSSLIRSPLVSLFPALASSSRGLPLFMLLRGAWPRAFGVLGSALGTSAPAFRSTRTTVIMNQNLAFANRITLQLIDTKVTNRRACFCDKLATDSRGAAVSQEQGVAKLQIDHIDPTPRHAR